MRALFAIIGVSAVAGMAAAAIGGVFTNLGSGFGGLWGVPALMLTLLSLGIGIPAGVKVARGLNADRRPLLAAVVVVGGVFVVAFGYAQVAHSTDPCANGWLNLDSRIGSQPLCERFGSEVNWHTRFHLAAHALPALGLLAGYTWAINKWVAPPLHTDTDTDTDTDSEAIPNRP